MPNARGIVSIEDVERDIRRDVMHLGRAMAARNFEGVDRLARGIQRLCIRRQILAERAAETPDPQPVRP